MSIYVLQVRTGREADTQLELWRRGYRSYVPRELRSERRGGQWTDTPRILMPGYVFADTPLTPADHVAIKSIDPVLRVLGDPPQPLSDAEAQYISWLAADGGILGPSVITVGSTVRVQSGPLKELEACILKIHRRQRRAVVAVPIHGREHHITLSIEVLSS